MSQPQSTRGGRTAPAASTATRGVIVVVFALFVGFMLLWQSGDDDTGAAGPDVTVQTGGGAGTNGGGTSTTAAPVATTPPAQLKVTIANGSDVRGLAKKTADTLMAGGYSGAVATDATQKVTTSVVYFVPGAENDAQAVAAVLGLDKSRVNPVPPAPPVRSLGDTKVLVVLGPDAPAAAPPAAGGAPTTTASP